MGLGGGHHCLLFGVVLNWSADALCITYYDTRPSWFNGLVSVLYLVVRREWRVGGWWVELAVQLVLSILFNFKF